MGKIASGKSENAYGEPSFQAATAATGFSVPAEGFSSSSINNQQSTTCPS